MLGAAGFLIVDGIGICERAFGSTGCMVERRRSAIKSFTSKQCFSGETGMKGYVEATMATTSSRLVSTKQSKRDNAKARDVI